MGPSRVKAFGMIGAALAGALLVGTELQRPAAVVDTHPMRETAASRLINDPRFASVLTQSAQHALLPLRSSNNDLRPSPIERAAPEAAKPATSSGTWITPNPPLAFNNDLSGMPQNTESLAGCNAGGTVVGAYDDYRNQAVSGDISAWSISTDGGKSLTNSNFLPGVTVNVVATAPSSGSGTGAPAGRRSGGRTAGGAGGGGGSASGTQHVYVPTQGDPVIRATQPCAVYATSLAFNDYAGPIVDAVIVDLSDARTLTSCTGEKACWPTRRAVAVDTTGLVFYDKPTIAIDPRSSTTPVWIGFTRFAFDVVNGAENTSLRVVRCDSALVHCSAPAVLESDTYYPYGGSGTLTTPTWASVAPTSDETVHVSWATVREPFGAGGATVQVNFASAPPGTLAFGSPVRVTVIDLPLLNPFASEVFQVNGFPDLAVSHVGGVDRLHIVFGECRTVSLGICEHSEAVLATSRTGGSGSWSLTPVDPGANSDFFPTVTADRVSGNLLVGFLTTRFDPAQHSYDVLAVPVNAASGAQSPAIRVTSLSIEPDNDSVIDTFVPPSIGDYWELSAYSGTAWAHFTTTQRLQALLGQGVQVPQQDNALARFAF